MPGYATVPDFIREQIAACNSDTFYVGRALRYSLADISSGALTKLGVSWDSNSLVYESSFVPPVANGRWSKYNIEGRENVRRDLPKVNKTIGGWQTPNFGDWKKGSHTHSTTRDVYQREVWYAQQLPIVIDAQGVENGQVTIGFRVDRVFDRSDLSERDLRLAISLIRENLARHAQVSPTTLSTAKWLADQRIAWEILPRGEATFERIVSRLNASPSSPRVREMQDRYLTIERMHPGAVVVGAGEFSRYFGFKFREDLVALENLDYGNALYLMFDDWAVLSKRSRIELLADADANYRRVIHRPGWEDRLKAFLTISGHDVTGG